jgi:hypothetical protein
MRVLLALALLATAASADPLGDAARAPAAASVPGGRAVRVAAAIPDATPAEPMLRASAASPPTRRAARHAIYLELGGRAGLWGVGYDWQPHRKFALGAAASYYSFDGDHVTTFAPYVAAYPLGSGRHRGFVQLGPTVSRRTTPSPVPEWDGASSTRVSAEVGAGYEYRHGVLARVYLMASKSEHLVPWFGASVGWTL